MTARSQDPIRDTYLECNSIHVSELPRALLGIDKAESSSLLTISDVILYDLRCS